MEYQVEVPDNWLKEGNPFEIRREEYAKRSTFWRKISVSRKDPVTGKDKFIQENYESVMAVPYDMPIVGIWQSRSKIHCVYGMQKPINRTLNIDEFDRGNYHKSSRAGKTIAKKLNR